MANTKRMTITQALVELKLYDSKIVKAIRTAEFINIRKKNSNKIGSISVDKFEKNAIESYQSIIDMIKNREAIKRAIVLSNATTIVNIAGIEMTVAEAIEKRNLINHEKTLIDEMSRQFTFTERAFTEQNDKVDEQAEKLLVSYYGKDAAKKISKEDYDTIVTPYKEANGYVVVDPIGLKDKLEALSNANSDFMANVDVVLSVSNATTFIEVEV